MEAINAANGLSVYLPLALYAVIAIVGWRLLKKRRSCEAEQASYWQACYIKLNGLARSHRLRAAEFEIQAEKFRLRWQQEQRTLHKRRFDEMFFRK
jgi:hypothetical protein